MGLEPVLVHARNVALIAKSRKKTDRHDADTLCDLLRTGFLPTAHAPSKGARELRELTRHHDDVVKNMTQVKNRVHSLLERAWAKEPEVSDLFGHKGRAFLETTNVSEAQRVVLNALLQQLDALQGIRDVLEHEIAKRVLHDPQVDLLLSQDGISVMGAATLRAEIDTPDRFPNRGSIRSNFGVATSVRDSADTERRGRITKQGPGVVRKYLVQGAPHFVRNNENSKRKHASVAKKRGRGVARMAVAGDMLDTAYQVLKTETPYKFADPKRVAAKRRELTRLAARPRKRRGNSKRVLAAP
jgi:transposase